MAENVGYATLDVIPSLRGFSKEISRQGTPVLKAAGRTGGKAYGDAAGEAAAGRLRTHLRDAIKGNLGFLGGAAVGAGAFSFFKGAIEGASDLAETTSKLRVVFGKASNDVESFAKDSTKNILLTEQAADDAAATFGVFGKAAGLTGGDLSDFAVKLTGLASDLSSFANTSTDDAIVALGAALRGESEPIRAYGVLLDDATLRAEALKQGLIATTKEALTPQQRVLAAYAQIIKQTKDAQGDAARTADGYANSTRILQKSFQELRTEVGEGLLPALNATVHFLNDQGVPALRATGGAVGDAVGAFRDLPAPVQAATGALLAFKAAQRFGVTDGIGRSVSTTSSALTAVQSRLSEASATWREYRSAQIVAVNEGHKFVDSTGRIKAGLASIRTASRGAGGALKSALGGALGLVGGPWGAAFIGGTALLTKFWQENQEAKARVEALTDSLNKQTGAITKKTKAQVFDTLQQEGAIDAAKRLGINLRDLVDASVGNEAALSRVNSVLDAQIGSLSKAADGQHRMSGASAGLTADIGTLRNAIGGQNDEVSDSIAAWKDQAAALGDSNREYKQGARAVDRYSHYLVIAKDKVDQLLGSERARRLEAIKSRRDNIALREVLRGAREEANKGKAVLFDQSKAADANMSALLDLADQWNNSDRSVRRAKGAYAEFRKEFIRVAGEMGATEKQAKNLAEQLLQIPRNAPLKFQSEGYAELLAQIQTIKDAAKRQTLHFQFFGEGATVGPPNRSPNRTPTTTTTGGSDHGGDRTPQPAGRRGVNVNIYGDVRPNDSKQFFTDLQRRSISGSQDGWR